MKPLHYGSPRIGMIDLRMSCLRGHSRGYIDVWHGVLYQAIQPNFTPGTLTIRSRSGKMFLNVAIPLCLSFIIYLTYNSVNTTTKYNSFVYNDTFRLE